MEGLAASQWSSWSSQIKKLNSFFDNNKISIDGSTSLSMSENIRKIWSYGWNFMEINGHS